MAHVAIVIECDLSIEQINDKLDMSHGGNAEEHMAKVANFIAACQGSTVDATVQVTSLNADPGVATDGGESKQLSLSLK